VEEHSGRRVDYTYDDLHRLTQEAITDPVHGNDTISYSYDAVGNRLSKTDSGGTFISTYDDNDRILTSVDTTYTYDDNGNTLTTDEDGFLTEYFYNSENQLIQAFTDQGEVQYQYDADGLRTWKMFNGTITDYLVDKNRPYAQVLEEFQDDVLSVSYTYGDDLLTQNRNGSVSYYLYDGHGSTVGLVDSSAVVTDSYLYDAFGNLLSQTGDTPNDYLYTGEQFDPNLRFYYLRARYYNQGIGRFHSMDSWMGNSSDPVTLHKYLYGNANPVVYVDPSGHFSLLQLSVTAGLTSIATFSLVTWLNTKAVREEVIWKGELSYVSAAVAGGVVIMFGAFTAENPSTGKKSHIWVGAGMMGPGVDVGVAVNITGVEMKTPPSSAVFVGDNATEPALAAYFNGLAIYSSLSFKPGIGSLTYLEFDQAKLSPDSRAQVQAEDSFPGIDIGAGFYIGGSISKVIPKHGNPDRYIEQYNKMLE